MKKITAMLFSVLLLACGKGDSAQPGGAAMVLPVAEQGAWVAEELVEVDAAQIKALAAEGKPVVVALWATWCAPCVEEMPHLAGFQAKEPGAVVIGLATDDEGMDDNIQEIFDRVSPEYTQLRLKGGEKALLEAFGLHWDGMLPKTLWVTAEGAVLLDNPVTEESLVETFAQAKQ